MSDVEYPGDPQADEEADEAPSGEEATAEELTNVPGWTDQGAPMPIVPREESEEEEPAEE